jgi:REP element-mobilizing transposase RayT
MPDHAHLLVGVTELLPLPKLVGTWKSRCYRAARQQGRMQPFWQRSFYDHALRTDEDLVRTARYVFANPVRAGLVLDSHDYPLCGSLEFDP